MADNPEWRGLFHAVPSRRWWRAALSVYAVTPLAMALLFAKNNTIGVTRAYLGAFVVGVCVGGSFHLLYAAVWPALIRRRPGWSGRLVGHAATTALRVLAGGWLAVRIGALLLGWPARTCRGCGCRPRSCRSRSSRR